MLKIQLGFGNTFLILMPRWSDAGLVWQIALYAVLLALPSALILCLILWLCHYELRLVSRWQAAGLLVLRLLVLLLIVGMIGLQPHVAEVSIEETPGRVRLAVDVSSSMDVIDVQRGPDENARLANTLRLPDVDALSRRAIVARLLSSDGANLLQRLAERHEVEVVAFSDQATDLQPEALIEKLAGGAGSVTSTDLSQALTKVTSRRAQPVLGIVVLTDGLHNVGPSPVGRAEELGKQRVPIYPIAIGSVDAPSDVAIVEIQSPSKVFKGATVPIEIRCKVANMPAQKLAVTMQIDGAAPLPDHRHMVQHDGRDTAHTVRFQAKMAEVGTRLLTVKVTGRTREITLANNEATRIMRVEQDKARILLVDGEARWEYHYLATALMRDPTLEVDRVVFSQPRIGSVKEPELEKLGHAKTKLPEAKRDTKGVDPLLGYDCILLGDVSPEQLPLADRRRLEKYVTERGGTLVLIAGKRHLPFDYQEVDDPLVKLLPITEPQVHKPEAGFALRASAEGKVRPFLHLEPDRPTFTWPQLPKHFWGVTGKRKPAASVLLTVDSGGTENSETGIFVQQNYGAGQVLFLGLDSTWRWRFRVGDTYHHRFWGQLVRWAAAEKLLPAGNRFVRYGSREPVYTEGQEIDLAVRASETLPRLDEKAVKRVKLYRQKVDGAEEVVAEISLASNARQPNLLEGTARDLPAGTYRMEPDIPNYQEQLAIVNEGAPPGKGRDQFRVLPREPKEWLELATNVKLLQALAHASDGKLYWPDQVEQLLERIERRIERKEHRHENRPWQDEPAVWWLLGVLLALLTLEWSWRKWLELP